MAEVGSEMSNNDRATANYDDSEWLSSKPLDKIDGIPDFGFRLRLDHIFSEPCKPFSMPRFNQIPGFIGPAYR